MGRYYFETGDVKYIAANDNTTVIGTGAMDEKIILSAGVDGIVADSTIERIDFVGDISNYKFQQGFGSNIKVLDSSDTLIATLSSVDEKELAFTDGTVALSYTSGTVSVGGTDISGTASAVVPATIDTTDTSAAGGGSSPVSTDPQSLSLDTYSGGILDGNDAAYTLTDSVKTASVQTITNFGADDSLIFQYAALLSLDNAIQTAGDDIIISYNKNGTVSRLTLEGANDSGSSVDSVSEFNALDIGDITIEHQMPHDSVDLGGLDLEWVVDTSEDPYGSAGFVRSFVNDSAYGVYNAGSGVLISPVHVLTNSHVVMEDGSFGGYMDFYAGQNGDNRIQASAFVVGVQVYAQSDSDDTMADNTWPDDDIAILTLSSPIGNEVGYYGLLQTDEDELVGESVFWSGYPQTGISQDNPATPWEEIYQWTASGEVFDYSDSSFYNPGDGTSYYGGDGALWFTSGMAGAQGASGSPIFYEGGGEIRVVGVYSGSVGETPVAANIDADTYAWINNIVTNDGYALI